jgi:hypothetical protein
MRKAHKLAIAEFQAWLEAHPAVSHERKVRKFDVLCDSALLKLMVEGKEAA